MDNFWTYHSEIYLIFLSFFPRIALLFCNVSGNVFFWLGWFFLPRITIAILATIFYASTDPILVILSWIIALSGETAEKKYGYKIRNKVNKTQSRNVEYEVIE